MDSISDKDTIGSKTLKKVSRSLLMSLIKLDFTPGQGIFFFYPFWLLIPLALMGFASPSVVYGFSRIAVSADKCGFALYDYL
jgi:hypothetical protein